MIKFILLILTLNQINAQYWPFELRACLSCDWPLFETFNNGGYLPDGSFSFNFPRNYHLPCECPKEIEKFELNDTVVSSNSCFTITTSTTAYCCNFKNRKYK